MHPPRLVRARDRQVVDQGHERVRRQVLAQRTAAHAPAHRLAGREGLAVGPAADGQGDVGLVAAELHAPEVEVGQGPLAVGGDGVVEVEEHLAHALVDPRRAAVAVLGVGGATRCRLDHLGRCHLLERDGLRGGRLLG